jgi:hypothetical protein
VAAGHVEGKAGHGDSTASATFRLILSCGETSALATLNEVWPDNPGRRAMDVAVLRYAWIAGTLLSRWCWRGDSVQ